MAENVTTANKWIPDRKWLASGITGILTWAIVTFVATDLDPTLATSAVGVVMGLVFYFVPPSISDVVKRVDEKIIELAGGSAPVPAPDPVDPVDPA